MDGFSIFFWSVIAVIAVVLPLVWGWKICRKAGYSGLWTLIQLVPFVNLVFLWIFAFADWPNLKKPAVAGGAGPRDA